MHAQYCIIIWYLSCISRYGWRDDGVCRKWPCYMRGSNSDGSLWDTYAFWLCLQIALIWQYNVMWVLIESLVQLYEYHLVSTNLSCSHNSERMALNKITLKYSALDKFAFLTISICYKWYYMGDIKQISMMRPPLCIKSMGQPLQTKKLPSTGKLHSLCSQYVLKSIGFVLTPCQ